MFSSAGSSSGTPLARVQTETSLSSARRRPRPRSPPSMYVAYESNAAKVPKPLIKLDKKGKGKETAPQQSSSPTNSLRPRANTAVPSSSSSSAPSSLRQRPSLSSFLNVRRKNSPAVETEPVPSPRAPLPAREASAPSLLYAADLHETNIHPFDDIHTTPRRSDKAARMLGKLIIDPLDRDLVVSEFSGTFRIPPRSPSPDGEQSSLGEGSSVYDDEDEDNEWFVDDAHLHRESRLISPIEFAPRPPSRQRAPPSSQTLPPEDDDESAGPATPIAELPTFRRYVSDAPIHTRRESYASMHDHYSDDTSRESRFVEFRPDTPFLDTLVAVNSQVVVSPRHVHARSPSVVRTETKEGWMGEWNQGDMKDVIHKLRSLK
ncbi:hypothetical protein C8R45DRAFT_943044 [Mycena sanguinolenta]|nr:hypothetical protein C8R45DRAFT_943044 [Mycena sanguinolenta]